MTPKVKEEITACLTSLQQDWAQNAQDWQPGGPCHDDDDGDEHTLMLVTFGTRDGEQWGMQTGSTDYVGGCYGLPVWAQVSLDHETDIAEAVREISDQWDDEILQGVA